MKQPWKQMSKLGLLCMICCATLWGELSVTITSWQQRWPWNGLVDITYSVTCDEKNWDGSPMDVRVSFTGYDQDLDRTFELKTLTGDGAGKTVQAGGTYTIVWNADQDYPNLHSSAFRFTVDAVTEAKPQTKPENGRYLVINLSEGATAKSYPWRYSETGPELAGDTCRTTELWLREIPKGTFTMGSPDAELGRKTDESQHQVTISKSFYMGVFEITQKQWELVMGPDSISSEYLGDSRPKESVSYDVIRGTGAEAGAGWPAHEHKVDATSFLGKLQTKTGLTLDLPTEAHWEYACRAGTTTALNSGKDLTDTTICSNLAEVGRYSGNQKDGRGGYGEHTRVGSYEPNAWGLYDMHGNVQEWCLDWYNADLGTDPVTDPKGAEKESRRLLKGGNWMDGAKFSRSANRNKDKSYKANESYGFRICGY